jgi:hypothetical protein
MFGNKIRTAIIALVASAGFAGASLVPSVASAKPRKLEPGQCSLTFKLANGDTATSIYEDGEEVTLTNQYGGKVKYKCVNGSWVQVATAEMAPTAVAPAPSGVLAQPEASTVPPAPVYTSTATATYAALP